MKYRNDTYEAVMACERARTLDYGDDCSDDRPVYTCKNCGGEIYEGDRIIYEDAPICEECMRVLTAVDFCELNGIDWERAWI